MSVFVCLCVVVSRERSDVKSEREREERLSGHEIWEYAWRFLDFFFGFKETSGDKRLGEAARGFGMDRFMQIFSTTPKRVCVGLSLIITPTSMGPRLLNILRYLEVIFFFFFYIKNNRRRFKSVKVLYLDLIITLSTLQVINSKSGLHK